MQSMNSNNNKAMCPTVIRLYSLTIFLTFCAWKSGLTSTCTYITKNLLAKLIDHGKLEL